MEDLSFRDLKNKVCVITGGGGVLGNSIARGLASVGVITVILDINEDAATKAAATISSEFKVDSYGIKADVLDRGSLEHVRDQIITDEKTGSLTPRGEKIIANTPMGIFGEPDDLNGTVLYLLSDLSRFVTGICIPIDGGYSAYGGV